MDVSPGRRFAVLAFLALNVATSLSFNRPPGVQRAWQEITRSNWSSPLVRSLDWLGHGLSWFGFLAGLEQRYTMFSTVHRGTVRYRITGVRPDGTEIAFPIEGEPGRSVWQRQFVDHKVGKFHLNLYGNEAARRTYARYLCRAHGTERALSHVSWVWIFRDFAPRAAARETGTHWAGPERSWRTERFDCPRPGEAT